MVVRRGVFFIKERTLAEALDIELRKFDEIVSLLESSLDSQLQLKESLHFIYQNKSWKIRIFSKEGAFAIANYLDRHGEASEISLCKVLTLVEKYRITRIDRSIRQAISTNSSSLILKGQQHWVNFENVSGIFRTTQTRLEQAFENIQRTDNPMKIGEDFEDIEQALFFSFSGLEKFSIELAASLYSKIRREYCKRVPLVAPPILECLALAPSPSDKDVEIAMRYAANRDKKKCQVTGIERDKYNPIKLVRHHIFDKNTYRPLADDPDNIILISEEISDEFHQWNGGYDKTCTINDFIEFVELFYSQNHEIFLRLSRLRNILRYKLSLLRLALPESKQ
ncbi:hypothetical protein [Nostoc sp.]|uniref:hypothetical protein n=1 Tax=Nostoc sp. TaxID=1180 RepID=UPI002FF53E5F